MIAFKFHLTNRFGTCCLQGKIVLPLLTPPPPTIQKLYEENDSNSISFRTNIREYNNANAFTSLGSTMESRTFIGRGPITIHGELRTIFGILEPTENQITNYGLYLLNQLLLESRKSLSDFPQMLKPVENWSNITGNRLIWEHRQFHYNGQEADAQKDVDRLNAEQSFAYTVVTTSVIESKGKLFFLNGGAGTGKTFVYNTIAAKCRSLGNIVITVSSSGIASLLLAGGRTAHSTFCIPLDVLEDSGCGFSKQSIHAELFREAKLIIWDEVPMQHRYCVEAVDRTLQDIRDNRKPFGGITVVLGGGFRQILPVIPKGVREQIVASSLRRSQLWTNIQVLTLTINMRLIDTESGNVDFANFLNEVGTNPREIVQLPSAMHRCRDLRELLFSIYPGLNELGTISREFLTEHTILSARNDDVNTINCEALNIFPGEARDYLAADKIVEDAECNNPEAIRYPNEYLNSLDPPGLPPFKLQLKAGCPIMLLRNMAPKDGLCNGTRLIVVRSTLHIIEAQILTGDKVGNLVFIPRISLSPSSSELPIRMSRRQFPVRLAFAMTINKSQGKSVKFVGVDLWTSVVTHGQLYVHYLDALLQIEYTSFCPKMNSTLLQTLFILRFYCSVKVKFHMLNCCM